MKGAILDRDGTLVDFHRDPELGVVTSAFHPDQLRLLPGVVEGLRALEGAGYLLAIATNQPGPGKGQFPAFAVERTNRALVDLLAAEGVHIRSVAVCMHHPEGGPGADPALVRSCDCRKPKSGLLRWLIADLELAEGETWMIGDTAADLQAGRDAGVRVGLLQDQRRCELCPLKDGACTGLSPDLIAPRLDQLAARILAS